MKLDLSKIKVADNGLPVSGLRYVRGQYIQGNVLVNNAPQQHRWTQSGFVVDGNVPAASIFNSIQSIKKQLSK